MPIQSDPDFEMMQATPEELKAIEMVWRLRGEAGDSIPPKMAAEMLVAVRQRAAAIEGEALKMLISRLSEGRRNPRRHQRFALALLAAMILITLLGAIIYQFFNS